LVEEVQIRYNALEEEGMKSVVSLSGDAKGITGRRGGDNKSLSQNIMPGAWLLCTFCLVLTYVLLLPESSWAHGFAGKRFFPTTFQVEDPFVSDEFSVLIGHIKEPEGKTTEVEIEYSKRILPELGISLGETYSHEDPFEEDSVSGFGNLEVGLKYQFPANEEHEAILSLGASLEIGGTGTDRIGASSHSTISPALYFGKGFGDLPESMNFFRPFAITGVISPHIPFEGEPNTLTWAFSLQYSLIYLQSFVKDAGLGDPFKRMVLVTEFPMETCMGRGCDKGQTTGYVNPGIVWCGKYIELGVAAQIPINKSTGNTVGVLGLVHFFIDDMFPKGIGGPIFP
jgi:hypothetical protein